MIDMNPFDTAWSLLKAPMDEKDYEHAAQFGSLRDAANRYKGKMTEGKKGTDFAEWMADPANRGKDLPLSELPEEPKPVEWPARTERMSGTGAPPEEKDTLTGPDGAPLWPSPGREDAENTREVPAGSPPVTMGTLDRQGRHVMPKKVSTEQNIAQLLGGGQGEEPVSDPDEFTEEEPKGGKRGNPSQEYWSDLLSGPMGGQGLDEGEPSRAELEEGGLDEGEEADPDELEEGPGYPKYLDQEAEEPKLPSGEKYREGHPFHDPEGIEDEEGNLTEGGAMWPHEVHQARAEQGHGEEEDALQGAMRTIHESQPRGTPMPQELKDMLGIEGDQTFSEPQFKPRTMGSDPMGPDTHSAIGRAVNRPEPMEEAMSALQPESESEEEPAPEFDEDPMEQAMSTLEPKRNVQTQSRINPQGPPPTPGTPDYPERMAQWQAGQKTPPKRGRRGR